jgi:hypothetical protein
MTEKEASNQGKESKPVAKFEVVFDGTRSLEVQYEDGENFRVLASSETGQMSSGTRRESKTWNWIHNNQHHRVQIQIGAAKQ